MTKTEKRFSASCFSALFVRDKVRLKFRSLTDRTKIIFLDSYCVAPHTSGITIVSFIVGMRAWIDVCSSTTPM